MWRSVGKLSFGTFSIRDEADSNLMITWDRAPIVRMIGHTLRVCLLTKCVFVCFVLGIELRVTAQSRPVVLSLARLLVLMPHNGGISA